MELELFSGEWARAWCEALNGSRQFGVAASRFAGSVALVMCGDATTAGDSDRRVIAELERGRCCVARIASTEDVGAARFVLSADREVWRGVLDGTVDPVEAVFGGRLRLVRGSLLTVAPHLPMARELLLAARGLATGSGDGSPAGGTTAHD